MKVFFVNVSQAETPRLPFVTIAMAQDWHHPFAVALAAALTALFHGALLIWYLDRPAPPAVTQAVPLPTIAIALAAPNAGAPAKTTAPPPPPKPELKPSEEKPKPKLKPKPIVKPKAKSEIKKKLVKPEVKPETTRQPPAPATAGQPATPAPAPAAQTQNKVQTSPPVAKDTPAHANAGYLHNPSPDYPRMARQRHWEGRVVLRVFVTADGRCGDLSVYRSSGYDVLDEAALDAVRQWRFVPGKHGDDNIASWVNVPIEFSLEQ